MATIYIEDKPYDIPDGQNLLAAALALGFDLPFFCWHPAMGSVGCCRQCAVKRFKDENDQKGKIVMAWTFPDHFTEIHRQAAASPRELGEIENEVLGIDHAELGALYLERHHLPELMVNSARYHHQPEKAVQFPQTIAAVQIADLLLRSEKMGFSGNHREVTREECFAASGWKMLLPDAHEAEHNIARASLTRTLEQLPQMLEGLV